MEKTYNAQYNDLIVNVIEKVLGERPKGLKPIPTYLDTIVCEVELGKTTVIFKGSDPKGRDDDGIGLEAWACEAVRAAGVPTPTILAVDTSRRQLPMSFLIMEKSAGQPLSSIKAEVRKPLALKAGALLRRMHAIELEGFGWLDEEVYKAKGITQGGFATWHEAVLSEIPTSLNYFSQNGALDVETLRAVERVLVQAEPLLQSVTSGRLLHGDLGALHVWVDPAQETVTSFVDFGDGCAGDPVWDFMRYEWDAVADLLEGYGPEAKMRARFEESFHL
jgi:aminoglycoside phosphotransferase (APT) family kinase protein